MSKDPMTKATKRDDPDDDGVRVPRAMLRELGDALREAEQALEQATDWRTVLLPHYETWYKTVRTPALAAVQEALKP